MSLGEVFQSEASVSTDPETGRRIRQVTSAASVHHHPFYYIPAYDDAMQWLFFVSHRTGSAQIFAEEREHGHLVQLTDRADLNEWSIHPSHDGRHVYFTAGSGLWRVDTEGFGEDCLLDLGRADIKSEGRVGGGMGTSTLSHDDRWWAVPIRFADRTRFYVIDTRSGAHEVILEEPEIFHPQFHPDDSTLLRYAGPYDDRLRIIGRDGSGHRSIYERDAAKKEWIVHETWLPGRREIVSSNWPHGVIGVEIDSGVVRQVTGFNAWHPMVNRAGNLMVADTNHPDIGLQLFDPLDGVGEPRTLCHPEASNQGEHWKTDHCPRDDGPVVANAPQHTHPHPNFSPDGSRIVFTSDRSGQAQIYEAFVGSMSVSGNERK